MPTMIIESYRRSFREVFKRFSVQILRLMLPSLRLPWDLLLRFLHSKTEKPQNLAFKKCYLHGVYYY